MSDQGAAASVRETPGPYRRGIGNNMHDLYGGTGAKIAHVYGGFDNTRIVACLNACAGFSTTDLETRKAVVRKVSP